MIRTYGFAEGDLLNHSYMQGSCGSISPQYAVGGLCGKRRRLNSSRSAPPSVGRVQDLRDCLENSRKDHDRLCLVVQESEMVDIRPVLAIRYTPNRGLFRFSRQSL